MVLEAEELEPWPEHPRLHVWGDPIQLSSSEGQEAKFCHDARPQGSQGCLAARTPRLKVLTKDGKPRRQEMIRRYAPDVQGAAYSPAVSLRGPTPQRELSGRRPRQAPAPGEPLSALATQAAVWVRTSQPPGPEHEGPSLQAGDEVLALHQRGGGMVP